MAPGRGRPTGHGGGRAISSRWAASPPGGPLCPSSSGRSSRYDRATSSGARPGRAGPAHRPRPAADRGRARSCSTRAAWSRPRSWRGAAPGRPADRHRRPGPGRHHRRTGGRAPGAALDVVRLHSGDPSIFSAVAEQARRLDAAGRALGGRARRARVRGGRGGAAPGADPARASARPSS